MMVLFAFIGALRGKNLNKKSSIFVLIVTFMLVLGSAPIIADGVSTNDVNTARATYNCYFVAPTADATVSGSYTVDFYGVYGTAKLSKVTIAVYQGTTALTSFATMTHVGSNHWQITWDTTTFDDGTGYKLTARAYRNLRSYKAYSVANLVIENTVTPPPPPPPSGNELTSGVPVTSSLAATGASEMWTIEVPANTATMDSILTCGSADFDLYGRLGAEPTLSVYDWRGYTSGGEEVTYDLPGTGTWYIMVQSYSGSGSYTLTVTLSAATPPAPWGNGGKYAIIVGISDYASISDLSYCDEDATDWYNQLNGMGYECRVYGDGHTANYPRHDAKATESTVRSAIQGLAAHAVAGDTVCFITSGHGSGTGTGSSFLCMYDCSGSAGCYYDTELAADIGLFAAGVKIFIFIDHCYSGGMGPELMSLSNNDYIYCTTTCTEDGYGYDDGAHQNGAWTYYFLAAGWQQHFSNNYGQSMESIFTYSAGIYPHTGGDAPMQFDGTTGSYFYLG
jgi:hypothetical protein